MNDLWQMLCALERFSFVELRSVCVVRYICMLGRCSWFVFWIIIICRSYLSVKSQDLVHMERSNNGVEGTNCRMKTVLLWIAWRSLEYIWNPLRKRIANLQSFFSGSWLKRPFLFFEWELTKTQHSLCWVGPNQSRHICRIMSNVNSMSSYCFFLRVSYCFIWLDELLQISKWIMANSFFLHWSLQSVFSLLPILGHMKLPGLSSVAWGNKGAHGLHVPQRLGTCVRARAFVLFARSFASAWSHPLQLCTYPALFSTFYSGPP
jgi:hypothetical protein